MWNCNLIYKIYELDMWGEKFIDWVHSHNYYYRFAFIVLLFLKNIFFPNCQNTLRKICTRHLNIAFPSNRRKLMDFFGSFKCMGLK